MNNVTKEEFGTTERMLNGVLHVVREIPNWRRCLDDFRKDSSFEYLDEDDSIVKITHLRDGRIAKDRARYMPDGRIFCTTTINNRIVRTIQPFITESPF